jgi:hypothetical protein
VGGGDGGIGDDERLGLAIPFLVDGVTAGLGVGFFLGVNERRKDHSDSNCMPSNSEGCEE